MSAASCNDTNFNPIQFLVSGILIERSEPSISEPAFDSRDASSEKSPAAAGRVCETTE